MPSANVFANSSRYCLSTESQEIQMLDVALQALYNCISYNLKIWSWSINWRGNLSVQSEKAPKIFNLFSFGSQIPYRPLIRSGWNVAALRIALPNFTRNESTDPPLLGENPEKPMLSKLPAYR